MKLKSSCCLTIPYPIQEPCQLQILMHATHKLIKCQIVSLTHLKIYFKHVAHIKTGHSPKNPLRADAGAGSAAWSAWPEHLELSVYTCIHTYIHIYCMCMGQLCLTMAMSYTTYRKCAKSKNTPESRQGHRLEGCSRGKERSLLPLLLPHSVNVNNKTQIKCIQRAPGNDYSNSSSS